MESFSKNANDLIQIHRWICGDVIAKEIMMRCFKRSRAERINEATVCAVLDEMNIWIDDDGNCEIEGETGR